MQFAAVHGIEPQFSASKAGVLPLDDTAKTNRTWLCKANPHLVYPQSVDCAYGNQAE